jgi:hypothetical protein
VALHVELGGAAGAFALRREHADDFLAREQRQRGVAESRVVGAAAEQHGATQDGGATGQTLAEAQVFARGERVERRRGRLQ